MRETWYFSLASSSGTPKLISWSKRPARLKAASSESGRFVAPMTTTGLLSSEERSSMQVKNWATIRLSISRCALSLLGVIASISSTNKMLGASFLASSKASRRPFSLSPDIPLTMLGALMLTKGIPSSPAMAYARRVFPQPGGPCSKTPLGGCTPM